MMFILTIIFLRQSHHFGSNLEKVLSERNNLALHLVTVFDICFGERVFSLPLSIITVRNHFLTEVPVTS